MKNLIILVAAILMVSCSKTGVQIKSNANVTVYSVTISYYDDQDCLLNSYLVADSLRPGDMSKIMDVENKTHYAKICIDALPSADIDNIIAAKEKANRLYAGEPVLPYVIAQIDQLLFDVKDKVLQNKYYVEDHKVTSISINPTNKLE